MTRLSKKARIRKQSPKKHQAPSVKTGPKKDQLEKGFKEHFNAITDSSVSNVFIAKIR